MRGLRALGLLTCVSVLGVVFACGDDDAAAPVDGGAPDGNVTETSSSSGSDAPLTEPTADLQLLTISDWHGQVEAIRELDANKVEQQYGGLANLKGYFGEDIKKNPFTIILTGGDSFGATPPISSFNNDEPAIKGLNFLAVAADTFGNHNFDDGTPHTKTLIELATAHYVSTNLTNVAEELGPKVTTPYWMVGVPGQGKVVVAILGLTNPEAPTLVTPGRMGKLVVEDPVASANKYAAEARAKGAHVVVALAHMGATSKDAQNAPQGPAIELAKGLKGVDVVIADHTDQIVNATINGTLVVENRSKGRTYSRITVKVQDGKVTAKDAKTIDTLGLYTAFLTCDAGPDGGACVCPAVPCPDATFSCNAGKCQKESVPADTAGEVTLLKPYKDALAVKFDEKVGIAADAFPRDGTIERLQETALGNLVADSLLDRYKTTDGAQIAFTNGGGIRDSLPSKDYVPLATGLDRTVPNADLVVGDVYSALRFNNATVVRKVKGKVLWQALEFSVAKLPGKDGRFLQIAGFKFTYDTTLATRITSVTLIDGNKVIAKDDETEYVAVTNDFTNVGGDGYTMLVEPSPSPARELMNKILYDYIKVKGTITPVIDGRITGN